MNERSFFVYLCSTNKTNEAYEKNILGGPKSNPSPIYDKWWRTAFYETGFLHPFCPFFFTLDDGHNLCIWNSGDSVGSHLTIKEKIR